ncbi:MAG: helix-turn-helix domain-containing protein [Gammaproteobacteria bacterium]|nr:helix-turn-helix domain-containing protein [Gammaproteobacteria bacterium]
MNIENTLNDPSILLEIGQRLAQQRLSMGLTQAELAEQAGIAKRTLERIEAGESAQMLTLIRLFRVLGLLPALNSMLPAHETRPMELLAASRQAETGKATAKRAHKKVNQAKSEWHWNDQDDAS